jgi:hypothetical protein
LEGFWDKTFERDIFGIAMGSTLVVSIDDVKNRVGAESVGAVTNNTAACNYQKFVTALTRGIGRSKFRVEYLKRDEVINNSAPPGFEFVFPVRR